MDSNQILTDDKDLQVVPK